MNERTCAQLRVIKTVTNVLRAVDISAWLFGGWGLDARIGRITRDHGDIEFWLEHVDAERAKAMLIGAGATALATQPPEEACEFIWDGVEFSTAYFDRQPDGLFSQPQGRWSDWLFPLGSFGDEPGMLDGAPVPAMSVSEHVPWSVVDFDLNRYRERLFRLHRRMQAEGGFRTRRSSRSCDAIFQVWRTPPRGSPGAQTCSASTTSVRPITTGVRCWSFSSRIKTGSAGGSRFTMSWPPSCRLRCGATRLTFGRSKGAKRTSGV